MFRIYAFILALFLGSLAFQPPALAESMIPHASSIPLQPETQGLSANIDEPQAMPAPARGRNKAAAPPRASSHPYYVEFRSRQALSYGHTFMAYGRLTPDGKIASQTIIGLHPAGDDATWWTIGHLVWVPSEIGPSDGDLEEEYISARYRIDLTPAQYQRVVAYAKKLGRESPMWHAVLYNCNAFVGRIAGFMGLKSPAALEYPADFVNGMRTMNGGVRTVGELKEPDVAHQSMQ
jgi:hypothetical protein